MLNLHLCVRRSGDLGVEMKTWPMKHSQDEALVLLEADPQNTSVYLSIMPTMSGMPAPITQNRRTPPPSGRAPAVLADQPATHQPMTVKVPAGMRGGANMRIVTPSGEMQVTIPDGLGPGQTFTMLVPAARPAASRVAQGQLPVVQGQLPVAQGHAIQSQTPSFAQAMPMGQPPMAQPMYGQQYQQPQYQQPQYHQPQFHQAPIYVQQQPQVVYQQQPNVVVVGGGYGYGPYGGGYGYDSSGLALGVGAGLVGGMMLGSALDGGFDGGYGFDGGFDGGGWD